MPLNKKNAGMLLLTEFMSAAFCVQILLYKAQALHCLIMMQSNKVYNERKQV